MNRLYVILSIATLACCLVFSNSMTAQTSAYSPKVLPPAPKSARVQITQGQEPHQAIQHALMSPDSNATFEVQTTLCLTTIQNAPGAVHTQEFPDIRT